MVQHLDIFESEGVRKFNNHKKKGKWLVLYHAKWCHHCVNFIPTWQKLKTHLKKRNVNCASIEYNVMNETKPKVEVIGFPTIHLLKDGKVKKVYNESDREIKTILKFVGLPKKPTKKKKKALKKKKSLKKKKL